jgi:8-oxo-dGTP pyrophosphatase MutT (NUDIX family)
MDITHGPVQLFASVFIEHEGNVLLIKEGRPEIYGMWNHPAGHLEGTETPFACAIREAKEETGYDIVLTKLQNIYYYRSADLYALNFCFLARLANLSQGSFGSDILETAWMTPVELAAVPPQAFRSLSTVRRVRDYLNGVSYPLSVIQTWTDNPFDRFEAHSSSSP